MRKTIILFGMIFLCSGVLQLKAARLSKKNHTSVKSHDEPSVNTALVCADDLLSFAQSLIGVRYRSASSSPVHGFDCSGFVSYVFKNFSFNVPRSSREFIGVGEKIKLADAKPGDVILFTGTSKRSRKIGHVAILMSNVNNIITFIHSTSGKGHGVTISDMDERYKRRFVQIIRLLKQNDNDAAAAGQLN